MGKNLEKLKKAFTKLLLGAIIIFACDHAG